MKCENCNQKIEKGKQPAYFNKKRVCSDCYYKLKNKCPINSMDDYIRWLARK